MWRSLLVADPAGVQVRGILWVGGRGPHEGIAVRSPTSKGGEVLPSRQRTVLSWMPLRGTCFGWEFGGAEPTRFEEDRCRCEGCEDAAAPRVLRTWILRCAQDDDQREDGGQTALVARLIQKARRDKRFVAQ